MRIKTIQNGPISANAANSGNLLKYGGVLLLGAAFLIFLGVLVFSSISGSVLGGSKCVAVVNIQNEITTQSSPAGLFSSGVAGSEDIAAAIDSLNSRDDVGAVLFVVDSPGGSVVASREIYDSVKALDKPKVAYFREVAASGAYYISAGTDYIVSDPDALTGSIGVIMTMSDLSGLFGKIGYNVTAIKSGEMKDIGSEGRPITDKERMVLQTLVDEIFSEFKSIVVENRGSRLDMARFDEILDGRVVSGRQAKEIGLVDALGTKKDAIRKAAQMANITDAEPSICSVEVSGTSGNIFNVKALIPGVLDDVKKVSVRYE